jgi:hypothetical protein
MLTEFKATPADYKAGLDLAIRAGMAVPSRERNLCEAHPGWIGSVRLTRRAGDCLNHLALERRRIRLQH